MRLDAGDRVLVIRADDELLGLRPVEDLVQQVAVARAYVELELGPAGDPAPADEPAVVVPEPHLRLAVRKVRGPPGDLAVVALAVRPELLRQAENLLEITDGRHRPHSLRRDHL